MTHSPDSVFAPRSNFILSTLPEFDFQRLEPHLKACLLHEGQILFDSGDDVDRVYFMKAGVASLVLTACNGVEVEVGFIGSEGIVGAGDVLAGDTMAARAVVQVAGSGWRLDAEVFRTEFRHGGALQQRVLRYQHALAVQTSQCVLCNRLHSVEQRLSRWLLMAHDRVQGGELELTHEFIATMLGTRRVGVTVAAGALRELGLIEYQRGNVTILDRAGLEKTACECYAAIRKQSDRSMEGVVARPNGHSSSFNSQSANSPSR